MLFQLAKLHKSRCISKKIPPKVARRLAFDGEKKQKPGLNTTHTAANNTQ